MHKNHKMNDNFNKFFSFILTFVNNIGVSYPNNNKEIMQINKSKL
jgi:hypothetical protein